MRISSVSSVSCFPRTQRSVRNAAQMQNENLYDTKKETELNFKGKGWAAIQGISDGFLGFIIGGPIGAIIGAAIGVGVGAALDDDEPVDSDAPKPYNP